VSLDAALSQRPGLSREPPRSPKSLFLSEVGRLSYNLFLK
jgi:hypothetical protein